MPASTTSEQTKCLCGSSRRLVIHLLDAATIIFIVGLQGGILNYYLIKYYNKSTGPYFYFLADLFTMIVFAGTLTTSFNYLTKKQAIEDKLKKKANFFTPARLIQEVEENLPWSHQILGVMPFSYLSCLLDYASEKACLQVTVLQNVLRLTAVDLPFLAVRLYLWVYYHENASLFLMKNVFNIILVSRTLCPDLKALAEDHFGINQSSVLAPLTALVETDRGNEASHYVLDTDDDDENNRKTTINL